MGTGLKKGDRVHIEAGKEYVFAPCHGIVMEVKDDGYSTIIITEAPKEEYVCERKWMVMTKDLSMDK